MRFAIPLALSFLSLFTSAQSNLFEKAESQYVLGNHREALATISKKIDRSGNADDYLLRALIYAELDIRANAHDDFVHAISRNPDHLEAYYHFANFLTDSHDYERAVAALGVLLEKSETAETQGIFFRIDRLGDQRVQVSSLTNMQADILMSRGLAFQGLGMLDNALTDFNAAIFMHETADKYVNRANLFKDLNQEKKAIDDLKKAVTLNPKYGLAWFNLFALDTSTELPKFLRGNNEFGPMMSARAVEAMERKQYNLADKLYKAAIELNREDDLLLTNAGRLDLRNGFNRAALKKFMEANELNPERKEVLYLIGNAYFGLRKHASAIEYYEKYLRHSPTAPDIWYNTAMSYLELKKYENACDCLVRSSELGMSQADAYLEKYCTNE